MSCGNEEKLNAYADGELPAAGRGPLEAHLASCEACRRAMESLRAQDRDLDAAFAPIRSESEALAERISAAVRVTRPRRRWLPLAAAAAAGFFVALLLLRERAELRKRLADADAAAAKLKEEVALLTCKTGKDPLARLTVAKGAIQFRSSDIESWKPLATGRGIEEGYWIRTGERAKCSFDGADGTEVRLNECTEIQIQSPRRLALIRGEIFTHVAKNPVRFEVRTDQARIEALGTTLDVSHAERQGESEEKRAAGSIVTTLTVLEGKALMEGQAVEAGFTCASVDGKLLEPSKVGQLTLLTQWVHEILILKGDKASPEFEKRLNELLARIGQTKMENLYESEIRALGDHCALPLTRYIQSPDSRKDAYRRKEAARILADVASAPSVPDFIDLLRDDDPEVRAQAARGLQRLTGQNLTGHAAWSAWHEKNRSTWCAPRP